MVRLLSRRLSKSQISFPDNPSTSPPPLFSPGPSSHGHPATFHLPRHCLQCSDYPPLGPNSMRTNGYGGRGTTVASRVQHGRLHTDDIININVGGKKYTVRRTDLLADPRSRLADWFRPGTTRLIPADKGGNFFLDRDPKVFRHILGYLRLKKERCVASLALPSKPDDLSKLIGECEALNLVELREMALEMLQKYIRTEEQHYVTSYVQMTLRDYDAWQFEQEQNLPPKTNAKSGKQSSQNHQQPSQSKEYDDEWD